MSITKDTVQLKVIIDGAEAGGTFKDLRSKARDLTRELSNLTPGTDAFIKKAAELKGVNDKLAAIRASTRGVAQGFDDAGKRINPLTDLFKKGAAAAAGFFAIEHIVRWGKELVNWAIKGTIALEDMRDKSARVFGDAIHIVEDFAAINAQSLGVTEEEYVSLASKIGNILKPLGFTKEAIAKQATEVLNLSGALAEWSNGTVSVEQANDILAKALLGRTKGLLEFGIAIKDTDIKQRLSAEGLDKLTGSALAQAKAQVTLQLITEKSRDAQIEFADSAEDLGRSSSRLTSVFKQWGEDILKSLLPGFKALAGGIADVLSPMKHQSDQLIATKEHLNLLVLTLRDANLSENGRLSIIKQLNAEAPEFTNHIFSEKDGYNDLTKALGELNTAMDARIQNLLLTENLLDIARRKDKQAISIDDLKSQRQAIINQADEIQKRGGAGAAGTVALLSEQVGLLDKQIEKEKEKLKVFDKEVADAKQRAKDNGLDPEKILNQGADAEKRKAEADAKKQAADDEEARKKQAELDAQAAERARQARFKSAEESIKLEQQLKLSALDKSLLSEKEFAAKKQIIDLEADIETNAAKLKILKLSESDRLAIIRTSKNDEHQIEELNKQISLAGVTDFFNKEAAVRSQFAVATIRDHQELSDKLQLIELERLQKVAQATLANLQIGSTEYINAQTEITKRQTAIDELNNKIKVDATIKSLKHQEEKELEASEAIGKRLHISEEDQGKERLSISLKYAKKILEEQLKLITPGSPEEDAIRRQLADNARQQAAISFSVDGPEGGSTSAADQDKKKKHLEELKDAALSTAHNIANSIFSIESQRIDSTLKLELDAIDAIEKRKLEAAGTDSVLQKKIHAEAARDRAKAEKDAARERKKIAKQEAIIQGALAVVEALPNLFAAAAAAVATAIQIATIDSQTFAKGGYTAKNGAYRDHTGHEVAGVVHVDEWVAPKHMVDDPKTGPVISQLERIRTSKRGFADGGFTSVSTVPVFQAQTITSGSGSAELGQIRDLLRSIDQKVGAWPRTLKAFVSLTDLEAKQKEINYIRDQSVV